MTGVRRAQPADLGAIAAIERACFGSDDSFSLRQIRWLLASPTAHWWIIDSRATACWIKTSNGRQTWARLYSLAVHPQARGQGLARQLLQRGFRWMATEGLTRCFAEVAVANTGALRLYRSQGFVERTRLPGYYGPGRDGISLLRETTLRRAGSATRLPPEHRRRDHTKRG